MHQVRPPPPPKLAATLFLAAIMQASNILYFDIYRGGPQFRRISIVVQKYFDALPCFSHNIHTILSINCKYISFYPNVPCLNVILTKSLSVSLDRHNYYRELFLITNKKLQLTIVYYSSKLLYYGTLIYYGKTMVY